MESGTEEWLKGVGGNGEDDVYVVGENGTILHYDGISWSPAESGTTKHLYGISGISEDSVYVVGENGIILNYNGISWSPAESGISETLRGVWGNAADDVFAVGDNGTILHFNGSEWNPMESQTTAWLLGVWGYSETNVYAVGGFYDGVGGWGAPDSWNGGVILHYDGHAWSEMSNDIPVPLFSVWGSSNTNIYAVGSGGTILHYTEEDTCIVKNLYGAHADQVALLRMFRDDVLNTASAGQKLVRAYYEWSPFVVTRITQDELYRSGLKKVIDGVLPLIAAAVK
jgi:photosystem II stability/assembly factor-like uncharacterized protein